ncbi:MAG: hypothetical protein ACLR5S_02740 [Ruminococcus sp.]
MDEFLEGLHRYTLEQAYPAAQFGARVFKIASDERGNRLSYLKITGGSSVSGTAFLFGNRGKEMQEKISQIGSMPGQSLRPETLRHTRAVTAVTGF